MYEFIEGNIDKLSPAQVVLENNGIGYLAQISVYTYEKIRPLKKVRLWVHMAFRIENQSPAGMNLYGFGDPLERDMFLLLTGVSGVGNNTAMLMLSSLQPDDIASAILNGNVPLLKSIKGIGEKTAQRIVLELRDKLGKTGKQGSLVAPGLAGGYEEAAQALQVLGFARSSIDKALHKITDGGKNHLDVEELIKNALKIL